MPDLSQKTSKSATPSGCPAALWARHSESATPPTARRSTQTT